MEKLSARDIQIKQLDILIKLDKICSSINVKYFLFFGSLLGAIRHKGFIPWDDDIDVVMLRRDYEKFLNFCMNNENLIKPLKILNYRKNKEYIYPISRLCDTRYHIKEKDKPDYGLGIFVDVYPMDYVGDSSREISRTLKLFDYIRIPMNMMYQYKKGFRPRFMLLKPIRSILKLILLAFFRIIGHNACIRFVDCSARFLLKKRKKEICCIVWPMYGEREIVDISSFETVEYLEFEGYNFAAPTNACKILRKIYGDFMKLPPEEQRVPTHNYYLVS